MANTSRNIVLALLVVGVAVAVFYMMDPTFGGLLGKREGFQAMAMEPSPAQPMQAPQEPILPPNNPPSMTGMQVEKFQSGADQKKTIDSLIAASKKLGEALKQKETFKGANGDVEGFQKRKASSRGAGAGAVAQKAVMEQFQDEGFQRRKASSRGAGAGVAQKAVMEQFEGFQNQNQVEPAQPANCYPKNQLTPEELLPNDPTSKWAAVNPEGTGDISGKNFLSAGALIGVNTVGQSLRNANQQLRSEPPCPQVQVSIWNQSTIEPDLQRKPLEGF